MILELIKLNKINTSDYFLTLARGLMNNGISPLFILNEIFRKLIQYLPRITTPFQNL